MKRLFLSALMLVGLTASAQEKVRVHIGNESFVTLMDYLTFDVDDSENVVSIPYLLEKAKDLIDINVQQPLNGNIAVSKLEQYGGDVIVNVTPYSGYILDKLEVNNVDVTDDVVNNQYVIKNVKNDQLVYARFVENVLTLNESSIKMSIGSTFQLTANHSHGVVWTSSNTQVATVDATGKVTTIADGNATITASKNELVATCNVLSIVGIGSIDGVVPGGVVKEQIVYFQEKYDDTPKKQKINIESGSFKSKGIVKVVLTSTADGTYWKEDGSSFVHLEKNVPTLENVYICPTTDKVANPWDNEFFIQVCEDGWAAGETHKVSYFFGSLKAVPFTTEASDGSDSTYYRSIGVLCHLEVGYYKHWNGAGNGQCLVDGKWHKIDEEYTVDADADGMKTFSFNLNDPAPANIFFFTEIAVDADNTNDLVNINIQKTSNGRVSASKLEQYGGDVIVNVTPYSGYMLDKLEVNNVDVTDDVVNNQYVIKNVWTSQQITAEFAKKDELTLNKSSISVNVGSTYQLTANHSHGVVWTSSAPEIATIDANGLITMIANGNATIVASKNEMTAVCYVTVSSLTSNIGNVDGVVPGGGIMEFTFYDYVATGNVSRYDEPEYEYIKSKIAIESGAFKSKGIYQVALTSTQDGMYWKEDHSAFDCREYNVPTFDNVYVCPTTDMVANPWDNVFFIQVSEDGWGAGETHKVSYFFGTLKAVPFVAETQDGSDSTYYKSIAAHCHVEIGDYKHWNGAGCVQCIVDGKWHKIDADYTVDADADGMKTFAFNLNDPAPANIFFFTEISVE